MDKVLKIMLQKKNAEQGEKIQAIFKKLVENTMAVENALPQFEELSKEEIDKLAADDLFSAECASSLYLGKGDADAALPYIMTALRQNSRFAAEMLDMLYANNLCELSQEEVLTFVALLEQGMDDSKQYKRLCKVDPEIMKEIDFTIFMRAVSAAMVESVSIGTFPHLTFTVEQALKGSRIKEYEKAFFVSLALAPAQNADAVYEKFATYVFFDRVKKTDAATAVKKITALLDKAAAVIDKDFKLSSITYDILGVKTVKKQTVSAKEDAKQAFYASTGNVNEKAVKVDLVKSQSGVLELCGCPFCGKPLIAGEKFCQYCGASATDKPKTNSKIDRDGNLVLHVKENESDDEMILLSCTQCASPIKTNAADGENVVCPSCGASYLMNKKAISLFSDGIQRQKMEQNKPRGAEAPSVNFAVRPLYNSRIGIIMPDNFTVMSPEIKAIKYPRGNPPELVLTDERGAVNFTFSPQHGTSAQEKDIKAVSDQIRNTFKKLMPSARIGESGAMVCGNHNLAYFECITPAEEDIYNFMTHFILSGTLMMASFNCLAKDRWYWGEIFMLAAQSMKFSD